MDASHTLLRKLRENLEPAIRLATAEELEGYQEILFWMFFTGTCWELSSQQDQQQSGSDAARDAWFGQRLRCHAKLLRLTSWKAAQETLSQFIFHDVMCPKLNSRILRSREWVRFLHGLLDSQQNQCGTCISTENWTRDRGGIGRDGLDLRRNREVCILCT